MSARLRIQLLGDFAVERDGAAITLPTRKAAALLAILAMSPGAPITRERLADLLWSRSAEVQARGSLRQAVAQLRKALEDDDSGILIETVGPGLRLASRGVEVDAATLEHALSAGSPADLELAGRLYQGEFLAGLAIEEAPFEDWRTTEAERLRRVLLRGLQTLLAHHVDRGDLEASLDLGERLVRMEPLAEETYQALMRLHLGRGALGSAMREYQRCRAALAAGLGVAPSAETEALRRAIRARPPARPSAHEETESVALPVLAVLPFSDTGERAEDAGRDYFVRGFTEDVVSALARFRSLRVISAQSSFAEADLQASPREIGEGLGAHYLLVGSLGRGQDRVRLSTELLDVHAGHLVWSDRDEVSTTRLPETRDAIAGGVAAALAARIDGDLLRQAMRKPLDNLEVYDCWLRGMARLREGTPESLAEGRPLFRRALELDPGFARAHSGLSLTYFNDWSCLAWQRWHENERKAFEHARDGAALDETDHVTHFVLGRVLLYRREFARAEQHLDRAEALNPNDADMLAQLAIADAYLGRAERGAERIALAMRLNPYHDDWYFAYAVYPNFVARRLEAAIGLGLKAPHVATDVTAYLAAASAHLGQMEAARRHLASFREMFRRNILQGREPTAQEPMRWLLHVNPFSRIEDARFWADGLAGAGLVIPDNLWRDFPDGPWPS
ncbi:BTAD domain-containing putative transcriptional regulator [Thiocapsa rosea]|uniref:DNA-binding SARP family transcriptional activator n=1 Tax=Thiocapsa rosea TaxID=69360 RepID=A0A495V2U9_9GAMM|nr:BTAD domain-containing putative transcriptional regulator [Thiocapsa rosea]RKT43000.1 DNA-binding SARP family transcriptional activator [Thiocapsa rosea]